MDAPSYKVTQSDFVRFVKVYVVTFEQPSHVFVVQFYNRYTYRLHIAVQETEYPQFPHNYEHYLMRTSSDMLYAYDEHSFCIDRVAKHLVLYCFQPLEGQAFGIDDICFSTDDMTFSNDYYQLYRQHLKLEEGSAMAMELVRLKREYQVLSKMLGELKDTGFVYDRELVEECAASTKAEQQMYLED